MKHIGFKAALTTLALLAGIAANAACYGSGAFQTCTDNSGNTYNVQRYGNTTEVQGSNASTGSNWSQQTQTYGNTTYHQGIAGNGQGWNGTSQTIGNTTYHNGVDSRGNIYNKVCDSYGCN